MIRRSLPVLLPVIVLLCGACAPDAPQAPAPAPPAARVATEEIQTRTLPVPAAAVPIPAAPTAIPDLLGWWDRPDALAHLGLAGADGSALGNELRKLERSYQTAQRQLHTVRLTQLQMLRDPRVPSKDIRRFNRENLQQLRTSMRNDDIAARLWVRDQLSAEQQARVLQRSPGFYGKPWFRAAKISDETPAPVGAGLSREL
jgi:hypothetical protein